MNVLGSISCGSIERKSDLHVGTQIHPSEIRKAGERYGNEPLSLLVRTLKYSRLVRLPRAAGSGPESSFRLARSNLLRCVSFANSGAIVPATTQHVVHILMSCTAAMANVVTSMPCALFSPV